MTSTRRAAILLVVAAFVVSGIGWAAYVHEQREAANEIDASSIVDASADARPTVAKAKAPAKKKSGRAGKTQVTARKPASGAAHPPSTHPSPAHANAAHASTAQIGGAHESVPHDEHSAGEAPPAPTVARKHYGTPSGPSYDSALDSNNRHVAMGAHAGADLTDAQLHGPMSDGWFVGECGAPDNMAVTVKVAVKMGRAVGVSVSTSPRSADVANCIDHHVRALSWPASPNMDSFVTTY